MKRKIAILLALVMIVSLAVGVLAGCDRIFVKSEARDAAQVVATVTYNGQTATVSKAELTVSFNNYAYLYTAYYGMTYQEAADTVLRSLAQRELLVLFAKDEIAKALGETRHPSAIPVEELLSTSEIDRAIKNVNDDILSALSSALEERIAEKDYNEGTDGDESPTYEEYTGDDAVRVYFESNGGSDVSRQSIKSGTTAFEPDAPTRDGYTFMGWFTAKNGGEEWDFATPVDSEVTGGGKALTLYAHWEKYTAPRTERPDAEEDEDADYDPDSDLPEGTALSVRAFNADGSFNDDYKALVYDRTFEPEALADMTDDEYKAALDEHLAGAVADIADNMSESTLDYNYYLTAEYKSLLITRLERMIGDGRIGDGCSVSDAEVQARFDALVEQNEETFTDGESYQSAIESTLDTVYYHKSGYGFVLNILLKLPDEQVEELTALIADGTVNDDYVTARRDAMLNALEVYISNPDYDSTYECDRHTCESGSACDPMTCPDHPCKDKEITVREGSLGLDQIVEFVKDDETGEWSVVTNVSVCPEMAYLPEKVVAFGEHGIVRQIYDSLAQVRTAVESGDLTHVQGLYWIREVATTWLYLVGDDTGSVSSDSNNGGLGYVVTPKGEESGYIDSFTEQARALIGNGGGSFERTEKAGATEGNFYVFGDNFIGAESAVDASSAYAGVFILVASAVPYDTTGWGSYTVVYDEETDSYSEEEKLDFGGLEEGVLPMDYVLTHAADLEDVVTVRGSIEEALLSGKRTAIYEKKVNTFGTEYYGTIVYNEKAYKSLWKDLD